MTWKSDTELAEWIRCPDCAADAISLIAATPEGEADGGGPSFVPTYRCGECSKELCWEAATGVLNALPTSLDEGAAQNLQHYDEMSTHDKCIFTWRETTRNHAYKWRAVSGALQLDERPDQTVLEIGTGYGSHAKKVVELGHSYVGADISPGLLCGTSQRNPHLKESGFFLACDAQALPLADELFDGCFMVATLHHIPDPALCINEALRVLKPGGRLAVVEPRRYYPTHFLTYLRDPETEISVLKMTPRNIRRWTQEAGGHVVSLKPLVFTPNSPKPLLPVFDVMDKLGMSVPFLAPFSMMMVFTVQKS